MRAMKLTEEVRRELRGRAHRLKPCVLVGNAGVTPAVLKELEGALEHHELVKVRVRAADREGRDAAIDGLVAQTGATALARIGHVVVLYRPRPDAATAP